MPDQPDTPPPPPRPRIVSRTDTPGRAPALEADYTGGGLTLSRRPRPTAVTPPPPRPPDKDA